MSSIRMVEDNKSREKRLEQEARQREAEIRKNIDALLESDSDKPRVVQAPSPAVSKPQIKLSERKQEQYDISATNRSVSATNISDTNKSAEIQHKTSDDGLENAKSISATNISATNDFISDTKVSATNKSVSATNKSVSATNISATNGQRMNQWKKDHRDTIRIDVEKGQKDKMKEEAVKRGYSLSKAMVMAFERWCENTPEISDTNKEHREGGD